MSEADHRCQTTDEKIAFIESLPPDFWEWFEIVLQYGPLLKRLLESLAERRGPGSPIDPPIDFGAGPPAGLPDGARFYVERYDEGEPMLWFHTGVKTQEWERMSAVARLG